MPLLQTSLTRKELLQKCINVIETFDPKKTTVDAYVQDTPILKDKRLGEVEHKFVHQVFYGCVRYQKFLKMFVTSFLYKCPTCAIRSEQTLYMILGYLLFFRLEELEVPEFREIVRCGLGTDSALLALLQYALSVEEIEKWVKVEWCKLYDVTFIENEVIGKLQSFKEELTPVVEEVELKATGAVAAAEGETFVKTRKTTVQKPFNLTKVRPRLIPEPEIISREVKAQPVPASSKAVGVLQQVEEEKRLRLAEEKSRVKEKYSDIAAPTLHTHNRFDHNAIDELTKRVEAEKYIECTFKPVPAKKYTPPTEEALVRQNAASVLREDALLKKKQQKEAQILKRYEEDLHDESEFQAWKQKIKLQDDLEEENRVRQRMVEMQLAREEAMEAFEHCKRKKNIVAQHHKEEMQQQLLEVELEKHAEHAEKEKLVAETQEDRVRARIAEQEILDARAEHAEKLRKEKEAEFERKRREDQFEMERRKDLIRQIRALEKVPVERFKGFDRAEPPCQGLMEEMSYAELQERLKLLEAQHVKALEEKKERQLDKKLEKQRELTEKAETLVKIRDMAKEESKQRHAERKARAVEIEERKQQHRDKCVEEAAEKIARKKKQKRDEELALKRELKEIATRNAFRQANAEAVEAKAHAEQQLGLEREARERKRILLTDQRKLNAITKSEKNIRMINVERDAAEYKVMQNAVTDRLQRAKVLDVQLKSDIQRAISSARDHQKGTEIKGRQEFGHSTNPYIQKVQKRLATSA